eukprot:TRINITY_DN30482_c0_g1_i1.p1 TRINITY_DN30482_c0_g1~~TRINITY_DN30482_c0_g1_i1.p1  ORF type:complete len:322 (+),score=122.33 TRINITY_DN30482_c0_g1_i1:65-1030(+)
MGGSRQHKGTAQYWMAADEAPVGADDLLMMNRFTCPAATTGTGQGEEGRRTRVSRAAKRREKRAAAAAEEGMVDSIRRIEARLETRRSTEAISRGRRGIAAPLPVPRTAPISKAAVAAFGEEGARAFALTMNLFLLDGDMKVLRYAVVDKHERKVLQAVAKAYRVTTRCSGNGAARVLDFVKTKSTRKLEEDGFWRASSTSSFVSSDDDIPGTPTSAASTPTSMGSAASGSGGDAGAPQLSLELQYQALLDAGERAAFRALAAQHDAIGAACPATDGVETMHARLRRADGYLKHRRETKYTQARRKERVSHTRRDYLIALE